MPEMKTLHAIATALLVSGLVSPARPQPRNVDFGPETLGLINSHRASRGLPPLASRAALMALARQHNQYQAARGAIGHDGYARRLAQAKAAGFSGICVENVGYDYRNAEQLFSGWRRSARHNRNLLRPDLRYAGVSVVGAYATFFACR
ncbi:MAG TPA: CAP domain-containing protein [Rhizobiaceae bacterium]|nr:CAP domain-containing protein [Rhizobiaceae bacterium]